MEHQTINAYGNEYKKSEYGYDWLLQHEFAHEWFGNQLTNKDWDDMPLITLQRVDYGVGGPLLLDSIDLSIEPGERIGIDGIGMSSQSLLVSWLPNHSCANSCCSSQS